MFRLFIDVNHVRNIAGGSVICVCELILCLFVSDNKEIYFNVTQPRLKLLNISYQSDYPIARTLRTNFKNFRKTDNMLG